MSRSACCVWLLGLALAEAADDGDLVVGVCTSDKEGDLGHEACYGWCSASQAADHCPWCKCKGCVWCASNGGASDALSAGPTQECQSAIADDVSYEDCQDFCSVSAKETHCQMCKCRAWQNAPRVLRLQVIEFDRVGHVLPKLATVLVISSLAFRAPAAS